MPITHTIKEELATLRNLREKDEYFLNYLSKNGFYLIKDIEEAKTRIASLKSTISRLEIADKVQSATQLTI